MHLKENQEFGERATKNAALSDKMNQNALKFKHFEQLALYSSTEGSSVDMIIPFQHTDQQSKHPQKINLQIILGMRQPTGPKAIEKILFSIINMVPKPHQAYSVLYINTLAGSNAYADFKKIMEFLPVQYFKHLDKVYVLHANFKSKANYWISFDYLTNYLKAKTVHLSSFKELTDRIAINKEILIKLLPAEIGQELARKEEMVRQILEVKKIKENIVFNPHIYNFQQETYVEKKPPLLVMGTPIKAPQPQHKSIEQYEVGRTGAPLIIELLISYFNGKESLLNTEGLFRKSVSIEEEAALLKELSEQNYDYLENVTDPHLIANAIKRFLSNLAEPIIPFEQFNQLMEVPDQKFNEKTIQIVRELQNNRKMTLLLLVDFLKEKLLPRTELNKMTQNNLSIVLGPALMRSELPSLKDLIYTKKSINATLTIFKEFDQIFGNAQERIIMIRRSVRVQERQTFRERLEGPQEQKQTNKQEVSNHILLDSGNGQEKAQSEDILSDILQMMKQEISYSEEHEVYPKIYANQHLSSKQNPRKESIDQKGK